MPVVYKLTFPNGKIYVGKDETDSICYFGSPNNELVAADFTLEERRSFTVTKDILWESAVLDRSEINAVEKKLIVALRANEPSVGYNRWPKYLGNSRETS